MGEFFLRFLLSANEHNRKTREAATQVWLIYLFMNDLLLQKRPNSMRKTNNLP